MKVGLSHEEKDAGRRRKNKNVLWDINWPKEEEVINYWGKITQ
jgi:hypothetical protein